VTGRKPCNLDVRVLDLHIRSGNLAPPAVLAQTQPGAETPDKSGTYWWLVVIAAAALGGLGLWFLASRKSRTPPAAENSPDAGADMVEAKCPSCQKRLRLAAHRAGRRVKCPGCAAAFVA